MMGEEGDTKRKPSTVSVGGRASIGYPVTRTRAARPHQLPYVLALLPAALLFMVVIVAPVFATGGLSLTNSQGAGISQFVGLANFRTIVTTGLFWQSVRITCVLAACGTGGAVLLGTLLATASMRLRVSMIYGIIWFLPFILPLPMLGVYWYNAFQPTYGVVDSVLGGVGLGANHAWLASPGTALYVVVGVWIWIETGFCYVMILGAMRQISPSIHEAATVDGASGMVQFRAITFPLIRPVLVVVVLLEVVFTVNAFALVTVLTNGGPGDSTLILGLLIYRTAFVNHQLGLAAAQALGGGLLFVVLAALLLRFAKSRISQ